MFGNTQKTLTHTHLVETHMQTILRTITAWATGAPNRQFSQYNIYKKFLLYEKQTYTRDEKKGKESDECSVYIIRRESERMSAG